MLTIGGKVTTPTCSADIVNAQVHQRCSDGVHLFDGQELGNTAAKGVVTEVVALPGDSRRKLIRNSYD